MGFLESVVISIFSIVIVFIVLVVISVFIDLLKKFFHKDTDEELLQTSRAVKPAKKQDEDEIVAVITAAISEYLGTSYFKVNTINRIKEKQKEIQVTK